MRAFICNIDRNKTYFTQKRNKPRIDMFHILMIMDYVLQSCHKVYKYNYMK